MNHPFIISFDSIIAKIHKNLSDFSRKPLLFGKKHVIKTDFWVNIIISKERGANSFIIANGGATNQVRKDTIGADCKNNARVYQLRVRDDVSSANRFVSSRVRRLDRNNKYVWRMDLSRSQSLRKSTMYYLVNKE